MSFNKLEASVFRKEVEIAAVEGRNPNEKSFIAPIWIRKKPQNLNNREQQVVWYPDNQNLAQLVGRTIARHPSRLLFMRQLMDVCGVEQVGAVGCSIIIRKQKGASWESIEEEIVRILKGWVECIQSGEIKVSVPKKSLKEARLQEAPKGTICSVLGLGE